MRHATNAGRLIGIVLLLTLLPAAAFAQRFSAAAPDAQVTIQEVRVRLTELGPVVLLIAEGRAIPIFVDATVASSIQGALSGEKTERPMSHDLMHSILQAFGGKVVQAVITLKGSTFHAALTVSFSDQVKVFDSRSSDSIALAIHSKAPIIVARDLLESAGTPLPKSGVRM
jgi:bifunctional DNase/RNase